MGEALSKINAGMDLPAGAIPCQSAWYAVQTLHRYEQRIARDLAAKGYETYLPLLRETRRWTDRKKVIEIPALSGYLFVRNDASLKSRVRVLETVGVVRMLGDNHAPVPVPEIEIESLRRALESNAPCSKCESLAEGTLVHVKTGVLAGIRGRLVRIHQNLRLILSVSNVSQALSVEVALEDVEPISEPASIRRREIRRTLDS